MRKVERHLFVPEQYQEYAYRDTPLPIGSGQTISQPFIVDRMTQELEPGTGDRVLEVGTGSGCQAAVLAEIVDEVFTILSSPPLLSRSLPTHPAAKGRWQADHAIRPAVGFADTDPA